MNSKAGRAAAVLLITAVLLSLLPYTFYATDFEECYHCNKTGQFHCPNCDNKGKVVCDGCGGAGRYECPGENGKGKCDGGYYVCPSCNGDGLSRPIPSDGNAGPCGQCGGSGKLECWTCRGKGIFVCDRCNGEGTCACQNGDCIAARKIDYKCPYCKGTGFLGDGPGFPQDWNDGVHNVPQKGDHIITDHSSWTGYYYGTGETDKDRQQGGSGEGGESGEGEDDLSERRDPATGRDYVWFIDVGDGVFEAEGQHIVIKRDGSAVSGILDVKYNDIFMIEGITDRSTHVYLVADGFKTELTELNGDHEYSVASRSPKSPKVPFNVTLQIEYIEGSAPPDDPGDPGDGLIKRSVDFGGGSWNISGDNVTARINGEQISGTVKVKETDAIKLQGLNKDKMSVYLRGDDGFSVTLVPNGNDEVSITRYEEQDSILAETVLRLIIEERKNEDHHGDENDPGTPGDDRMHDFDIIPDGGDQPVSVAVRVDVMTEEERNNYVGIPNDELNNFFERIRNAVRTVQPGKTDGEKDRFLDVLAKKNGFDGVKDGRMLPIAVDGYEEIGFPVEVKIRLNKGDLDGGTDIYVYRQTRDGKIEPLGKAEYGTYDDGSIEQFSFYTSVFSDFFTAAKELDLNMNDDPTEQNEQTQNAQTDDDEIGEEKQFPVAVLITVVLVFAAIAAAAVVIVIVIKRKKRA